MKAAALVLAALIGAGCKSSAPPTPGPPMTLGLNDVTMLLPLPAALATPVLMRAADLGDDGTALVPHDLFDRLTDATSAMPILAPGDYDSLQIVSLRFDLCDRKQPAPCPDSDGRLRVVFQPLSVGSDAPIVAVDAALHAFYVIPEADLPSVVAELRALSVLQGTTLTAPLAVSAALSANPAGEYATRLRALVKKYGGTTRMGRLTLFAQPIFSQAMHWILRGIERPDGNAAGSFADIVIPGINATRQEPVLGSHSTFDVMPIVDEPAGFQLTLSAVGFGNASKTDQKQALETLAAIDNPLVNTAATVQCVSCHVATQIFDERAQIAGVDPLKVAGRFTSAYDLKVPQPPMNTLRALGYFEYLPVIAQRIANESAEVALEIDERFQ
jgi:hypothetical protein